MASAPAGQSNDISPLRVLMQDKGSAYGGCAGRQACHGFGLVKAASIQESWRIRYLDKH